MARVFTDFQTPEFAFWFGLQPRNEDEMNEKPQQNRAIAENLDPRALRAALQDRQASRPGLAQLLDRAAAQIRPAGEAPTGSEVDDRDD
ncbi:hypothetical protein [Rhodobacter capsulatus]|uniref:hypothetical protein n=2 Tax=Rhodobacter capsulatus TaxID=1061 RepID=UPI0011BD0B2E|nr:hypothetical protein [Rhodobacter capsulatus]